VWGSCPMNRTLQFSLLNLRERIRVIYAVILLFFEVNFPLRKLIIGEVNQNPISHVCLVFRCESYRNTNPSRPESIVEQSLASAICPQ